MASGHAELLLRQVRTVVEACDAERLTDRELLRRFSERRDEAAFAALVRRHGPMVLGVCRRVLHDVNDAEDAFQAAFFTLARKADTRNWQESVGPWVYLVAVRVARKLRSAAQRRALYESRAAAQPLIDPLERVSGRDLCVVVDEEISRLPEDLRAPLILCCLEGMARDEAARRLGWSLAMLKRRLGRGRERLRKQLAKRGIVPPAAFAGMLVAEGATQAMVPAGLARLAVTAAVQGTPSSVRILGLAQSALGPVVLAKSKIAVLLLVLCLAAGAALGYQPATTEEAQEQPPTQDNSAPTAANQALKTDHDGDPLPPEALARLGTTRLRHGGYIRSLHFTPDGKVLVARGDEDGVSTWDTATGNRIHVFSKDSAGGAAEGASLSPDGKLLATPGQKTLRIWDTATAQLLRTIDIETGKFRTGPYLFTCFSPDGKLLASQNGEALNQVSLWDPATGQQVRTWTLPKSQIQVLAFGDGKTLITAGDDNAIRAWDVAAGTHLRTITFLPNQIKRIALSGDGKLLATVGYTSKADGPGSFISVPDSFIRIWETTTGRELRRLVAPAWSQKADQGWGIESVAFSPGGKLLVTSSADNALYVCDPAGGSQPRRLWQGSVRIHAVAASPKGQTVAVSAGAAIHLIELASGKEAFPLAGHPDSAYKTAITPDGRTVVTASCSDLFLWDAASGRLRKRLQGHNGYINGLEIIDGGRKAVTSGYQDGTLRVWDLIAEKEAYRIESPDKANILQAVSPDGRTIAVAGSGSVTVLFDALTGKEIQRLKGHGEWNAYGAAFTPDGRKLVVWYCEDNMVYLWDLATGRKIQEYSFIDSEDPARPNPVAGGRPVYFAAVSPDGRLIAFGSQSRFLEVRDLASGEILYRQTKLPDGVCPMAFSPDSRMLAWSGWWNDPTVHLVEVATGKDRRRFAGHTGRVLSLQFSADGTMLVSGSADTTALVWDVTGKLTAGKDRAKPLSTKDIQAAWEDLGGDDAVRAYDGIRRLSAAPQGPVAFLQRHLKPIAAADEKRIARLIADLDADDFAKREKAAGELEALGELAADACQRALKGKLSAESRRRLERLRDAQLREAAKPSPEYVRTLRALEVLERARISDARQLLRELAEGAPGARLTQHAKAALARLNSEAAP
jgi:RNA polymerase sigma factor (sigma-70 family)